MRRFTITYTRFSYARNKQETRTVEGCTFSDGTFGYVHPDRAGGRGILHGQTQDEILQEAIGHDDPDDMAEVVFTWIDEAPADPVR